MKKFFRNKMNLFLLLFFVTTGGSFLIYNVEATSVPVLRNEKDTALFAKESKSLSLQATGEEISNLRYILRSSDDNPMGYVDSSIIRCFIDMGPVDFAPRYKYKEVGGATLNNSLYGFTIPLVGDLNGDGKPEIVALGSYNTAGVNGYVRDLYIFNGQTGEEIVRYPLPANIYPVRNGYHGSPSQIVLVDSDRNGQGEIIVCFSNTHDKKIISYEVNDYTFNPSYPKNDNRKLSVKWTSDVRYDAYGATNSSSSGNNIYDYPLPQIVDIDADGTPELIVYNKIYNAKTGNFIMKLGDLGRDITNKTINIGSSGNETPYYEEYLAFPFLYDIDGDGKYDYIAGGEIYYDIDLTTKTYKTVSLPSVKDGRTAVADINGDGKPEIVVSNYVTKPNAVSGRLRISVWTPNFIGGSLGTPGTPGTPELLAVREYNVYNPPAQGNHSYIYIGDIDGKKQNGKLLPEISILSGRPFLTGGYNMTGIPVHPNVQDGLITPNKTLTSNSQGAIVSFTWDNNPGVPVEERLKVSFMLEHQDRSINTGFTLFDFDNDGIQDICYRDERNLRIISAKKSYVTYSDQGSDIIRFTSPVWSFTGYEYPVIADVDGDASADMIVMGRSSGGTDNARGYIFALEGANGDLAPAPKVWNQFMYSPLKINEDLTTPMKTFNPLSDELAYKRAESDTEKVYIYNNTITQTTFYSINSNGVGKPIVRIPDVKILDTSIDMATNQLHFKLTNNGDASVNPEIPINLYCDGAFRLNIPVGSGGLFLGDTLSYSILLPNKLSVYTIVVGATIDENKNITPAGKYVDCNWADNIEEIASFLAKDDAATVTQYGTIMIDVLANDILNSDCATQILKPEMITTPAGQGVMAGEFGSLDIINNKLLYTAPKGYQDNIVELSYKLTCSGEERTAKVYIYIVESCSFGFASCAGSPYNVCVENKPIGVKFEWYDHNDQYIGDGSPNIPNLTTDMIYYVRPVFGDIPNSAYKAVQFPKGKIAIKALSSVEHLQMKWTGNVDTDWNNPANWVQVLADKTEVPVTWAPVGCTDVTIPGGAKNYPELKSVAECGKIHLADRAMISGIHHLNYTTASVDLKPSPTEKDRFLMWSAPLKDMYSGDYHFTGANNEPSWGHVYMNFFQSANPDYVGSVEKEKTFTATFGSTGTPLPLGKAFNVKVLSGKDQSFSFPKTITSYTSQNGESSGNLSRINAGRFITDGAINGNGDLNLPVSGNNAFSLIQVVNPFMAYLDMAKFFNANASRLSGTYVIWNGDVNADFITTLSYEENGEMRYVVDDSRLPATSAGYVAPLQSFFVAKKNAGAQIGTVSMNASTMTTTKLGGETGNYVLRSAVRGEDAMNQLRITASIGDAKNSTVLLRRSGTRPEFDPAEDAEKFFHHGAPVSIYSLTGSKKAVAINASETFNGDVRLGIRVKNTASPIELSFSGLNSFGQRVSLIDHAQNDKEIDLSKTDSYVFVLKEENVQDIVELNNRFSLRFSNDLATSIDEVINTEISIRTLDRNLVVSSPSLFDRVEVINISGMKVYDNLIPSSYLQIPVSPDQVYIVKVSAGKNNLIKKILVK